MRRLFPALFAAALFAGYAPAADLVVVPASVTQTSGSPEFSTAGATVTAGQALYLDPATNRVKPADADGTSDTAKCIGIALNGASTGQPVGYARTGAVTLGVTLTVGKVYVVSATAGGIAPIDDVASTWRLSIVGYATTTTSLKVQITNTDVLLP